MRRQFGACTYGIEVLWGLATETQDTPGYRRIPHKKPPGYPQWTGYMISLTFYCPRLESQPVGDNKKVNAFWAWQCSNGQGQCQGRRARAKGKGKAKAKGEGQWQGQCQGQWQGARFQSEASASFSKTAPTQAKSRVGTFAHFGDRVKAQHGLT